MSVDVLVVGAHPDDVELGVGGLVHKLAQEGFNAGILDLTRGEMSTRGSVEERTREGEAAARILGASMRKNAELPDGALSNTDEQRKKIIPIIRALRPRILIVPMSHDRHPDHSASHGLMRDANYFSGLARIGTGHEPYRTPLVYYYHPYFDDSAGPPFVVDISEHFDAKIEALQAHRSQFYNPDYEGRETFISSRQFWDSIQFRAAYWGHRVGVRYGEPLWIDEPMKVELPMGLGKA